MAALARWCFRRRAWVLVAWLALLVILGVTGRAAGSAYSNTLTVPGTGSTAALNLLTRAFPGHAGDQDSIVWRVSPGSVRTPAVRARMMAMLGKVAAAPSVAAVISPYSARGAGQVSRSGTIAYATVVFDAQAANLPAPDVNRVIHLAEAARGPGVQVELGGSAIGDAVRPSVSISAVVGLAAAAVVLFIVFGSLLVMLLPLAVAVAALVSGLMTAGLVSHAVSIPSIGPTLATLIGLGVGIDYALFVVTRHRNNIKAGMSPQDAAAQALSSSGRAVLFAGTTVCIALLGMLVLNISYVSGLGIAAAITVLFTMAAAITLLPALLGFLGMRVLSRRERRRLAATGPELGASGWWARLAAFVQRHPLQLAAAAGIVMVVLAIPVLSLRLGSSDAGNDPASSTTRQAYDLLDEGFGPGFNGPLQLAATTDSPADTAAIAKLADTLRTEPGVAAVSAPVPGRGAALISVIPTTSPEAAATSHLIHRLRTSVIPAAERGTTLHVYVGGITAILGDFATVIGHKLLLFVAVIIGLGFLLLMLAFRSLLVPATAAVMNLLAAGAAFGVLVAVFQFGWGLHALNLGQAGPVESFLPVLMLSVLFGLSMDYEVFLVSRIREEWAATGDSRQAVITGQVTTGRVIIAAATIMICVFSAFILTGQQIIGEFGIGLAAAVLLDAFILRTLLVPALMHLSGRANWWLPGWLDRILPHLSVEPSTEPPAQPSPPPARDLTRSTTAR
jgi:putative drug exporter of the RND superfamily